MHPREILESHSMEPKNNGLGLPKFNNIGGLVSTIIYCVGLLGISIWSLIAGWKDPFFPYQLAKIMGIVLGLFLSIHAVDVVVLIRQSSHKPEGK